MEKNKATIHPRNNELFLVYAFRANEWVMVGCVNRNTLDDLYPGIEIE